ncbi:MAG: TorF family putative porin [Candidatus Margulisiibacteriota bacterium]
MKKVFCVVLGLVCLVSVASAALLDVNVAYVSKYIWRGQDQDSGQPALQPGATLYLGNTGFSLGLWGNYNIGADYLNVGTGGNIGRELTEIDYTLTYAASFNDDWSYSVYFSQYTYPAGQFIRTGELFLTLTGNSLPLTPTLTLAYDNDQGKGSYVSLGGKNSFPVGALQIDSALTAGYDGGQYGAKPGFSDATLAFSTALPVNNLTVTPTVNYTVVGKDTRPTSENTFWFSLNVASSL